MIVFFTCSSEHRFTLRGFFIFGGQYVLKLPLSQVRKRDNAVSDRNWLIVDIDIHIGSLILHGFYLIVNINEPRI